MSAPRPIPWPVAAVHTLLAAVVVVDYWLRYGPEHLLWLSDVALIVLVPALWLQSRLLVSMMAVATLLLELIWVGLFAWGLLTGATPLGMAGYMVDPAVPLQVRVVSGAFHLWLPGVLLFGVARLGYDRRALRFQAPLSLLVLAASWWLTHPGDNVNYVHGIGVSGPWLPQPGHLALVVVSLMLLSHLPTHLALARWRGPPH